MLHHPNFPRCVPSVMVFAVYSPPDSQHEDLLRHHIICSVDQLLTRKPCSGILLLGDFNKVDIAPICNGNNIVQIVNKPIRQNAILDLIITNFSDQYQCPAVSAPIGLSDHNCITWVSKNVRVPNKITTKVIRPMKESSIRSFGRWVQAQSWEDILNTNSCQAKVDAFYSLVHCAIKYNFHLKIIKRHNNDKPWMTDQIKNIMTQRQRAFAEGNRHQFHCMSKRVIREINAAK